MNVHWKHLMHFSKRYFTRNYNYINANILLALHLFISRINYKILIINNHYRRNKFLDKRFSKTRRVEFQNENMEDEEEDDDCVLAWLGK